jgi:hypothetical protein
MKRALSILCAIGLLAQAGCGCIERCFGLYNVTGVQHLEYPNGAQIGNQPQIAPPPFVPPRHDDLPID